MSLYTNTNSGRFQLSENGMFCFDVTNIDDVKMINFSFYLNSRTMYVKKMMKRI